MSPADVFGSLAPSVTMDDEGKRVLTFGLNKQARLGAALDEVLQTPAQIAGAGEPRPLYRAGGHYPLGVFGGEFVRRHELGAASNVQRAL